MAKPEVEQAITNTGKTVNEIVGQLFSLGIALHDFNGTEGPRTALVSNINNLTANLAKLQNPENKALDKVPIPLDVLQYIEEGRNPDVYTREFVEATKKSNQYLRGKMIAMHDLRDVLGKKISNEFPELSDVVDNITKSTDGN